MEGLLKQCGYNDSEVMQTVMRIYPFIFRISANKSWQNTGLILKKGEKVTIKYISGRWYISPAAWGCDAEGGSSCSGRWGYPMPYEREGAVVGRIGNEVIYVGRHAQIESQVEGALELVTNDDLDGLYGLGLRDNAGEIEVEICVKHC